MSIPFPLEFLQVVRFLAERSRNTSISNDSYYPVGEILQELGIFDPNGALAEILCEELVKREMVETDGEDGHALNHLSLTAWDMYRHYDPDLKKAEGTELTSD